MEFIMKLKETVDRYAELKARADLISKELKELKAELARHNKQGHKLIGTSAVITFKEHVRSGMWSKAEFMKHYDESWVMDHTKETKVTVMKVVFADNAQIRKQIAS